jgi:hypothetical protein
LQVDPPTTYPVPQCDGVRYVSEFGRQDCGRGGTGGGAVGFHG